MVFVIPNCALLADCLERGREREREAPFNMRNEITFPERIAIPLFSRCHAIVVNLAVAHTAAYYIALSPSVLVVCHETQECQAARHAR